MKHFFALATAVTVLAAVAVCPASASTKGRHSGRGAGVRTAKKARAGAGRRSRTGRSRQASGPVMQKEPTAQRYQEIQQALADRGYYKGQVNGLWGADSVAALQRFQADNKLASDGKLNAPSLIGLGLGPKHEGAVGRQTIPEAPSNVTGSPAAPLPGDSQGRVPNQEH